MNQEKKKKGRWRKVFGVSLGVIILLAGFFVYNNFNRLLSEALQRTFDSSIVSNVYELKFERLHLNLLEGSIRVYDVSMQPRANPLQDYPYINSSFRFTTEKITLMNVKIFALLNANLLELDRISITKPHVQATLEGKKYIFLPFKDSSAAVSEGGGKKTIDSFVLSEFQLIDASFHIKNFAKRREFEVSKFNISLHNLLVNQLQGIDQLAVQEVSLSVGEFMGSLQEGGIKHVQFNDFRIGIDSIKVQATVDTLTFELRDFSTGLKDLDIHTADSLFHLTVNSFDLSYKEKSINLNQVSFKPNASDAAMQDRFKYQHTQVAGSVGSVSVTNVNFDSLIYHRCVSIDAITLDRPTVSIFKDNTKPIDKNRFPTYFGQQIRGIPIPLLIRRVHITNVNLVNVERKRDSSYARVAINRGTVLAKNITNRSTRPMTLDAEAYIENKVPFNLKLGFSYLRPEFSVDGKLAKFSLPDLNPVIQAYTPAKINAGTADEITFSGTVFQTNSSGTMKFLYHDLEVDLDLHEKAKWKSSVLAFAANSIVNSSNPGSSTLPPRIVQFQAQRDVNKGFVNIVIKSALSGIKETMIMSKENRKAYHEAKKIAKKGK